ncbi:MAG: FAD-binding oxidoreductase [Pseudomonadota bacterium]
MALLATPRAGEAQSLWQKTATETRRNPPLADEVRADVTVIGAGFTGLRAALYLAEAGSRVVVLDAGDVGSGASGRTGGQVNPMLPFNTPAKLRKLLGPRYFERLTETALGSADELFELIRTYQIDCQARQKGWLRVCHHPRAVAEAKEGVAAWNDFGADMHEVGGAELERMSGSGAYRFGVVAPRGGAVHPMLLAQGLAEACRQRGVALHGESGVDSLSKVGRQWVAKTQSGSVTSDWVLVATNGYTDSLIPKLASSILPATPIQIATDPLPQEVIGSILPDGHTISDSRRVIMYARREPDNRVVYGGIGMRDLTGALGGFDWLVKDAERVFPQLKGLDWPHRWGGRIALTDDHLPHLHEPQDGILVGLGYNGRGVAMSHVMGRVMAQRVLGAAPEDLPFPVGPIKAFPNRAVKATGMATAIWVLRLMDYLETRAA